MADDFTLEKCKQQNKTSQLEILSNHAVISEILIGNRFRMLSCNKLYKKKLFVNAGGVFVTLLDESMGMIQVSLTGLCAVVIRWHILLTNTTITVIDQTVH